MANENRCTNAPHIGKRLHTELRRAKKDQQNATQSVQRGLQVLVATEEVARDTLGELHRQGQVVQRTAHGVGHIEEDIQEAGRLVRFMRRFCCVAVVTTCCSSQDVERDAAWAHRARDRRQPEQDEFARTVAAQSSDASAQVAAQLRQVKGSAATGHGGTTGTILAWHAYSRKQGNSPGQEQPGVDSELEGMLRETDTQDRCLEKMSVTLDNLNVMGKAMSEEVARQAPLLEELDTRVDQASFDLARLVREIEQI